MDILSFIVIDGKPQYVGEHENKDVYSHTLEGEVYIPLETPIPIIRRGSGCIGIGLVVELTITKTSTTIVYSMSNISEVNAKAYYDLYRNQATASNTDGYQEDVVIPGMMRNVGNVPKPKKSGNNKRNSNKSHRSLMDYPSVFDDDYDDF